MQYFETWVPQKQKEWWMVFMECVKSLLFFTLQQAKQWREKSMCDWNKITKIVLVLFLISTVYTDIYTCIYVCSWKYEDKKKNL